MNLIVVNGFLGSGKTVFLKNCLLQLSTKKVAVIMNEFGISSFDAQQLDELKIHLDEINHGSIFCSCKSDTFVASLIKFMKMDLDYIFVESSGFADPSSLEQLVFFATEKASISELGFCSISVVDPISFPKLNKTLVMINKQIEIADSILLNKIDLVETSVLDECINGIRKINNTAEIYLTRFSKLCIENLSFRKPNQQSSISVNSKSLIESSISLKFINTVSKSKMLDFLDWLNGCVLRVKGVLLIDNYPKRIEIASGVISCDSVEVSDQSLVILYSSNHTSGDKIIEKLNSLFPGNWILEGRN